MLIIKLRLSSIETNKTKIWSAVQSLLTKPRKLKQKRKSSNNRNQILKKIQILSNPLIICLILKNLWSELRKFSPLVNKKYHCQRIQTLRNQSKNRFECNSQAISNKLLRKITHISSKILNSQKDYQRKQTMIQSKCLRNCSLLWWQIWAQIVLKGFRR